MYSRAFHSRACVLYTSIPNERVIRERVRQQEKEPHEGRKKMKTAVNVVLGFYTRHHPRKIRSGASRRIKKKGKKKKEKKKR